MVGHRYHVPLRVSAPLPSGSGRRATAPPSLSAPYLLPHPGSALEHASAMAGHNHDHQQSSTVTTSYCFVPLLRKPRALLPLPSPSSSSRTVCSTAPPPTAAAVGLSPLRLLARARPADLRPSLSKSSNSSVPRGSGVASAPLLSLHRRRQHHRSCTIARCGRQRAWPGHLGLSPVEPRSPTSASGPLDALPPLPA
jgi:hypothetical protein